MYTQGFRYRIQYYFLNTNNNYVFPLCLNSYPEAMKDSCHTPCTGFLLSAKNTNKMNSGVYVRETVVVLLPYLRQSL